MTRKKGKVVLVGVSGMEIKREDLYPKELDFLISTSYGPGRYDERYEERGLDYPYAYVRWTENRNMQAFLDLLAEKKLDMKSITTHIIEIKDALTGLYNQVFIRSSLKAEIKRAIIYHRPCGFILVKIDNFQEFQSNFGSLQTEAAIKKVAYLIKESVTELDHVGRFGDHTFAIVLPEKTKRQAKEIAEEIRKKIEFTFGEEEDTNKRFTVSGAVTENPLDGVEPEQLINKAEELADLAKKQGKNRILS
jgi:diguanylate cyclase (GGDEF)-like protein